MRIKRMLVLLLALMMTCTVFSCALADDDTTQALNGTAYIHFAFVP